MNFILYLLLITFTGILKLFPFRFNQRIAKFYGLLFYFVISYRKRIALTNLKLAFPEKDRINLNKILKKAYIHFAGVIIEVFTLSKINKSNITKFAEMKNVELIKQKMEDGKGLIIFMAHIGNWEYLGHVLGMFIDDKYNSVAKKLNNKYVDDWLTRNRQSSFNKIIDMNSLRDMLRVLKRKEILILLGDQSAPKESIKTKFFINDVPTFQGAATLALKTGAPVIFLACIRNDDLSYSIYLEDMNISGCTEFNEDNITKLTQDYINILMDYIRKYPEQYLWFHKRFKHNIQY